MKKLPAMAVGATGLLLAGCYHTPGDAVATGAVVGGLAGAGVGQVAAGTTAGTLVGAGIGTAVGGLAGAAASQPRVCVGYDQYGEPYEYAC